jgi:hypothetical protein
MPQRAERERKKGERPGHKKGDATCYTKALYNVLPRAAFGTHFGVPKEKEEISPPNKL